MAKTVLYIEDDAPSRGFVNKIMRHMGYRVIEAADGKTGLQLAEHEKPDLVLLDINLPDMLGLDVARQLKARRAVPIIAVTAESLNITPEDCLAAGCDAYLSKPISQSILLRTTLQLLEGA
ncbi:MAG: response regulator [Anaerolineae bacterium]